MQPTNFTCNNCKTPLSPGMTQCPNCGQTFDAPVPYAAATQYGQPVKKGLGTGAIVAIVAGCGCVGLIVIIAIMAAIMFPVFSKARDKARESVSETNLKQIGLATTQYLQDYDEKFPPMDSTDHFKTAIDAYVMPNEGTKLFVEPGTGSSYVINSKLSKKNLADFAHPEKTVLAQDPVPHSDGKIAVLYADGHVVLQGPNGQPGY